jgi:hypothetical protein
MQVEQAGKQAEEREAGLRALEVADTALRVHEALVLQNELGP